MALWIEDWLLTKIRTKWNLIEPSRDRLGIHNGVSFLFVHALQELEMSLLFWSLVKLWIVRESWCKRVLSLVLHSIEVYPGIRMVIESTIHDIH